MTTHRQRVRASLWDRFHDKVVPEPNSGCWLWAGGQNAKGYGIVGLGRRGEGTEKAHRVAYRLYRCDPVDHNVLHHCDTPCCVNPDHLYLGTLADNMQDCVKRGRNFLPDNRGERAPWAKLSAAAVMEIRRREKPYRAYAQEYGVSKSTVAAAATATNWKSLGHA